MRRPQQLNFNRKSSRFEIPKQTPGSPQTRTAYQISDNSNINSINGFGRNTELGNKLQLRNTKHLEQRKNKKPGQAQAFNEFGGMTYFVKDSSPILIASTWTDKKPKILGTRAHLEITPKSHLDFDPGLHKVMSEFSHRNNHTFLAIEVQAGYSPNYIKGTGDTRST
jgi:hypothetical protein